MRTKPSVILVGCLAASAPGSSGAGVIQVSLSEPASLCNDIDDDACQPLNAAACDDVTRVEGPRDIELTLTLPDAQRYNGLVSQRLFAWFLKRDADSTAECGDGQKDTDPLLAAGGWAPPAGDALYDGQAFLFPNDDLTLVQELTTATILGKYDNACGVSETTGEPVPGQQYSEVVLCFGFDGDGDGNVNPSLTITSDFLGSHVFKVDTASPLVPTITKAVPADKQVKLKIQPNDEDEDEQLAEYVIRYHPVGGGGEADALQNASQKTEAEKRAAASEEDCTTWTDATVITTPAGDSQAPKDAAVDLELGTTYEFCAIARDKLGNESDPSEIVEGTPRDETDFAEGYPGDLRAGYCGAAGSPGSWGAALGVLALLARCGRRRGS